MHYFITAKFLKHYDVYNLKILVYFSCGEQTEAHMKTHKKS